MTENINLADWYTASEAADRLTRNSGRTIKSDYPRKLAEYGKVRALKVSDRASLYLKADIDPYVVEDRGTKSGRAKRQQAKPKPKKKAKLAA